MQAVTQRERDLLAVHIEEAGRRLAVVVAATVVANATICAVHLRAAA